MSYEVRELFGERINGLRKVLDLPKMLGDFETLKEAQHFLVTQKKVSQHEIDHGLLGWGYTGLFYSDGEDQEYGIFEKIPFQARAHKEMWLWLMQHPEAEKHHWPGWEHIREDAVPWDTRCFACFFAVQRGVDNLCPLGDFVCDSHHCLDGLFVAWQTASTFSERSAAAERIANLPVSKWVKEVE